MGLLDDAIREHLDLKRRSGGDPGEIERLEREALGPVRREPSPSVYTGATAISDEPSPFNDEPLGGYADEMPTTMHEPLAPEAPSTTLGGYEPETGEYAPQQELPPLPMDDVPVSRAEGAHEEPKRPRRFLRGLSALTGSGGEEHIDPDDADDFDPMATAERIPTSAPMPTSAPLDSSLPLAAPAVPAAPAEPVAPAEPAAAADPAPPVESAPSVEPAPAAPEPVAPAAPIASQPPARQAPPPLALSGEHHAGPDEGAPEGAGPNSEVSEPAPQPSAADDEQATQVHRVIEPFQSPADEPFAEPPAPEPEPEDEGDPLEETPEFLQDTPEHDRLWFEQRPPRDFDFDQ